MVVMTGSYEYSNLKYLPKQSSTQATVTSYDAVSGYAMALAPRHDRVDYSVVKGGLRLWVVIFAFFMLLTGIITIFSKNKEFIHLEIDSDGDFDEAEQEEDDIDDMVHSETKYEQEKIDKSIPTKTADWAASPADTGRKEAERKEELEKDEEAQKKKSKDPKIRKEVEKEETEPSDGQEERAAAQPDEETLLSRLWEKMKKVEKQMRKRPEEEDTPAPGKRRKRERKRDAESAEEAVEEKDKEKDVKVTKRKAKRKPIDEQRSDDIGEEIAIEEPEPPKHKIEEPEPDEKTEEAVSVEEMEHEKPTKRKSKRKTIEEAPEPEPPKRKREEPEPPKRQIEEPDPPKRKREEPAPPKRKVKEPEPQKRKVEEPEPPKRKREEPESPKRKREEPEPEEKAEEAVSVEETEREKPTKRKSKRKTIEEAPEPDHIGGGIVEPEPPKRKSRRKAAKDEQKSDDIGVETAAEEEPSDRKGKVRDEGEGQDAKSIDSDQPAQIQKPKVRVFRVKGRPKEEPHPPAIPQPPQEEPEKVPVAEADAPARIPVRVIRRKGRPKEEMEPTKDTIDHPKEDEVVEKEPVKQRMQVRYIRIRGKKQNDTVKEMDKAEKEVEEEEEEQKEETQEKPRIPVRVFRTKGRMIEPEEDTEEHKTTALKVPEYRKRAITNREDHKIRQLLDEADRLTEERRLEEALAAFDKIINVYPRSPRARYGRARTLELMAADQQSSAHLDACILEYEAVLHLPQLTDALERLATDHLVDRARFRGWLDKAATAQRSMVDKYPDDIRVLNEFGITYLMLGRHEDAKKIFENVLTKDPDDGLASAYYGYILKTVDGDYVNAVEHMGHGLESDEEGELDGRFYFHLGEALQRLNRSEEAYDLYEQAADLGIFLSKYQRSLYNVAGLRAHPFWTAEETSYSKQLHAIESQWKIIRDEALALISESAGAFRKENEDLTVYGEVKEFMLYAKGSRLDANCAKVAKTCDIVSRFPASTKCTRCEVKFSLMANGSRLWPSCGPTNCRLRGHLGLVVPPEARVRVGEETKSWRQGKFVILDDSYEHELWHDGTGFKLTLVVDFWHPDLTSQQKASLTPV